VKCVIIFLANQIISHHEPGVSTVPSTAFSLVGDHAISTSKLHVSFLSDVRSYVRTTGTVVSDEETLPHAFIIVHQYLPFNNGRYKCFNG
jgi:ethanolamine utilization microcompartment shell protein EutS